MRPIRDLAIRWRTDAEVLERYDQQLAKVCLRHAEALEAALREADDELLTLADASAESGYSVDRLRHKVADGEIVNRGRKGAPRIARGDLPVKRTTPSGFDASAAARLMISP
jgi:hypothetical protein